MRCGGCSVYPIICSPPLSPPTEPDVHHIQTSHFLGSGRKGAGICTHKRAHLHSLFCRLGRRRDGRQSWQEPPGRNHSLGSHGLFQQRPQEGSVVHKHCHLSKALLSSFPPCSHAIWDICHLQQKLILAIMKGQKQETVKPEDGGAWDALKQQRQRVRRSVRM